VITEEVTKLTVVKAAATQNRHASYGVQQTGDSTEVWFEIAKHNRQTAINGFRARGPDTEPAVPCYTINP
jgi:hypothetical protein